MFVQRGKRVSREWSPRLERGYGQIIDWFHKLDDLRRSDDLISRFGSRSVIFSAVLVIGRDHHLKPGELERLAWRKANVVVASQKIECVTFDELAEDLEGWLATILATSKADS